MYSISIIRRHIMTKKDIKTIRRDIKLSREKPDYTVKWVIWLFILFVFSIWCVQYGKSTFSAIFLSLGSQNPTVTIEQTPVEAALSHIKLTTSYQVVEISSQKNLYMNLNIENNHDKAIKDFEIQCNSEFNTPGAQKLKVTILQSIAPHSSLVLPSYNFGSLNDNPKYVNCSVTDLVLN